MRTVKRLSNLSFIAVIESTMNCLVGRIIGNMDKTLSLSPVFCYYFSLFLSSTSFRLHF